VLAHGPRIAPGLAGVASTDLRPSGKARFGERLVDVVSSGDFIEAKTPIRVIEVEGARVVVASAAS
jgi:membrane-bound serine protease (ClpP class)